MLDFFLYRVARNTQHRARPRKALVGRDLVYQQTAGRDHRPVANPGRAGSDQMSMSDKAFRVMASFGEHTYAMPMERGGARRVNSSRARRVEAAHQRGKAAITTALPKRDGAFGIKFSEDHCEPTSPPHAFSSPAHPRAAPQTFARYRSYAPRPVLAQGRTRHKCRAGDPDHLL